jgi:predicted PurR-regulated permease PerM
LSPKHKKWIGRAAIVAVLIAAWFLRSVIAYFLVAALINFIAAPLMAAMGKYIRWKKKPLPRWVYALTIIVFLLVAMLGLLRMIGPPMIEQADRISHISNEDVKRSFGAPLADLQRYLATWGIDGQLFSPEHIKQDFMHWVQSIDIRNAVTEILSGVSTAGGWIFSVLFITFFFLKEKFLLYRLIHTLTPDHIEPRMQKVLRAIQKLLGKYFRSILLQILVFGSYIFIGLSIVGESYALTIAVFCGLMNLISYVGPILGLSFALLFSIGGHIGADFYTSILPHLLEVSTVFGVAILLDNLVSYPLIFSNSLKVHPLELFFVVLAGFQLAGLGGMIVAAPVYTMLRIIAKEFLQGFDVIRSITRGV